MTQGHDSRGIANIFVQIARKVEHPIHPLTIMSLVKYVYFAHGWTLGYTGKPLICHKVQAWKFGPVIPEVYQAFRGKGFISKEAINPDTKKPYTAVPNEQENNIIKGVFDEYSKLGAFELSYTTHHPDSPWSKCGGKLYSTISNYDIETYYQSAIKRINHG